MNTEGILKRRLISCARNVCAGEGMQSCLMLSALSPRAHSSHADLSQPCPAMADRHRGRGTERFRNLQKSHAKSAALAASNLLLTRAPHHHVSANSQHRDTSRNSSTTLPKFHFSAIKTFVKEDLILVL